MIYAKEKDYTLYQGKMQDVLDTLEENSIDSIVCDPPYHLTSIQERFGKENSKEAQYGKDGSFQRLSKGFMGKTWDGGDTAFQPDTWKHCYRVLKDGGYLLAFGGSRTFHRIACAIEDAGFEIRDTIMWLYGSGFPKSMDISKSIDKRGGNNYSIEFAEDLKKARLSRNLTMKYCDDKYCNGSTNWSWYEGRIAGARVPDYQTYLEIVKDFPELEKYRELIKEVEREVIGNITRTKGVAIPNCGEKIDRSCYDYEITTPTTDLAKQWNGWGTCLKPAYEPIIVARKPFKGSLVDNVIENGVGGINIDECRVETYDKIKGGTMPDFRDIGKKSKESIGIDKLSFGQISGEVTRKEYTPSENGRFPANVIFTYDDTDFDEVCGGMPETKGGSKIITNKEVNRKGLTSENPVFNSNNCGFKTNIKNDSISSYGDNGSASRYFYCAKASKKDRDEGLDMFNDLVITDGRTKSIDNAFNRGETLRKNIHPTVKPIELMQYLVRLVTPKNATILDCFMGSGSTGKAVMFENRERNANYHFIGVKMTEEYLPICKARIDYALNKYEYDFQKQLKEEKDKGQLSIFDFMEN